MANDSLHHEHTLVFHLGRGIVPLLSRAARESRLADLDASGSLLSKDQSLATSVVAFRLEEKVFLVRVRAATFEGALIVQMCPCCAEPGSIVLREFQGDLRAVLRWAQSVDHAERGQPRHASSAWGSAMDIPSERAN